MQKRAGTRNLLQRSGSFRCVICMDSLFQRSLFRLSKALLAVCVVAVLAGCARNSTSTVSPAPSKPEQSFLSGGLGLTKSEWEQEHTLVSSSIYGDYYYEGLPSRTENWLRVYFWSEQGAPVEDAPISRIDLDAYLAFSETIGSGGLPISFEQMERGVATLLPADAVLEKTEEIPSGQSRTVQIYFSDALARRYAPLSSGKTPWSPAPNEASVSSSSDLRPGTIRVVYNHGSSVSISAGGNSIPWRYYFTPEPTRTWAPDPPYTPRPPGIGTTLPAPVPTR